MTFPKVVIQSGDVIDDRYHLEQQLGEGGMGSVWRAVDQRLEKAVVIKFPHAEMLDEEGFQERFQREIRSLINLEHPRIIPILDVGQFNGLPYAVMRYLSGGSLEDANYRSSENSSLDRVLSWLPQVAEALDFVHQKGLVHRDVKPANILFDHVRNAYLADFGIVKVVAQMARLEVTRTVTQTGMIIGSCGYMAPELLMGEPFDGRVDQYALAVTVYEVLCGRRPFEGATPQEIALQQHNSAVAPLDQMSTLATKAMADAVARALNNQPEDRFPSCLGFAQAALTQAAPHKSGPPVLRTGTQPSQSAGTHTIRSARVETLSGTKPPPRPTTRPTGNPTRISTKSDASSAPVPRSPGVGPPLGDGRSQPQLETQIGRMPMGDVTGRPASAPSSDAGMPAASRSQPPNRTRPTTIPPRRLANRVNAAPQIQPTETVHVTCPWCWHRFRAEDLLWIAEHSELTGDERLEGARHRFLPDKFNAHGDAIDAMGFVCHKTACPRCHLEVPRDIIELSPLFVSVLGAPSAGKTCFLTSLTWQLRRVLPQSFLYSFSDADTEMNQPLIQNEQLQFMNNAGGLVQLAKTDVGGDAYRQVRFGNETISYLRPLIFSLRPTSRHPNSHASRTISYALCIYDNAGEHFLPGQDTTQSPATRHLAHSEAFIFLFDPAQHPHFRKAVEGQTTDPQFHGSKSIGGAVRQETLLTEALHRMRRHGGLSAHDKCDKPLAVLIGKYDAWAPRFEGKRLNSPWVPGSHDYPARIDTDRIRKTSAKMRGLLNRYCPELVAAAEDFSSDVVYIPVSAFGRRVEYDAQSNTTGVQANELKPMWVEVPLLYFLSQIKKGVVPQLT